MPTPIIRLASASPRRRELLNQIGVPHIVTVADINESHLPGEGPKDYVQRLARSKALAIWETDQSLPVLAADTTVVVDGIILGKPEDKADGLRMLSALSGRTHQVLTAVALAHPTSGASPQREVPARTDVSAQPRIAAQVNVALSESHVTFRTLTPEECDAYWETAEPRGKAGAYAIQGLAAVFIERLEGSYSGVMGLPLFETAQLLRAAALPAWCTMEA